MANDAGPLPFRESPVTSADPVRSPADPAANKPTHKSASAKPVASAPPTDHVVPAVLNEHEAAKYLGLSVYSLRRMRYGKMPEPAPPHLQLSPGRIGYRVATLDQWLQARERHS